MSHAKRLHKLLQSFEVVPEGGNYILVCVDGKDTDI